MFTYIYRSWYIYIYRNILNYIVNNYYLCLPIYYIPGIWKYVNKNCIPIGIKLMV